MKRTADSREIGDSREPEYAEEVRDLREIDDSN